jgi:hypothetical protein
MKSAFLFSGLIFVVTQFSGSQALGQAAPTAAAAPAPATTKATQPRIQFSETSFNFGTVKPTDAVRHDFIVTNGGNALLEITAVQPGCGCTTAGAWDRQVEPGKTGKIPIQFNPANFSGTVSKGVTVTCNDPIQPTSYLQIQATIWRPIDLQPQFVYFMPIEGEETNDTRVIRIINNLEEAVTLQAPHCSSPSFSTEVKTVRPGKEFELHVTYAGAVSNGMPQGLITIQTSTTNMPTLNITVTAMPQPAMVAMPQHIQLPAPPLSAEFRYPLTIRNNSRTDVKLSDPTVNAEGVTVKLQETQPGKVFTLSLAFPTNFQARVGQPLELAVKTTHPKHPVVKVPIFQAPPPTIITTPPAAPAASGK